MRWRQRGEVGWIRDILYLSEVGYHLGNGLENTVADIFILGHASGEEKAEDARDKSGAGGLLVLLCVSSILDS